VFGAVLMCRIISASTSLFDMTVKMIKCTWVLAFLGAPLLGLVNQITVAEFWIRS
jgi:hypothetical protein